MFHKQAESHDRPDGGRRRFLATGMAIASAPWLARVHFGGEPPRAESLVSDFYGSLSREQRGEIVLPFEHPHRREVNPNWHVTKPLIGSEFYTPMQRDLIQHILQATCSEEGFERLQRQMADDDGGVGAYSVAVLGDPSREAFEWMLTGRHCTLRIDGNSVPKTAFGGVLVYGHGEESSPSANLYFDQTESVNAFYRSLSEEQAKKALLVQAPRETDVAIRPAEGAYAGLAVGELDKGLQQQFRECLLKILSPYRSEDGAEAMEIIEAGGGLSAMRMAFYREGDLLNDGVWDVWRMEGPSAVIHFRGAPHVHAYIHIAARSSVPS